MAQLGKTFGLQVAAPGVGGAVPTVFTAFGPVRSRSFSSETATVEVVDDTTAGNATALPTQNAWTIEAETTHTPAQAGYALVRTAHFGQTKVRVKLVESTTASGGTVTPTVGGEAYEGWAWVTGFSLTGATNDLVGASFTFTGDGALTVGTVPA